MIKTNSIITMVTPITGFEQLIGKDFTITSITKDVVTFENEDIGMGAISTEDLYKYFTEKEQDVIDTYEIDTTPYSAYWTEWTEYINPKTNHTDGYYRYKDCPNGSVRLEYKFNLENEFTGRACCHRDDEFDLDIGVELCKARIDIKYNRYHFNKFNQDIENISSKLLSLKTNRDLARERTKKAKIQEKEFLKKLNKGA